MNKRYTKEFKEQAVRLVLEANRSVYDTASDLGIHPNTLYKWINQYREYGEDAFPGSGHQLPLEEECRLLKKELAETKMELEIIKKAAAIFAKDRK